LVNLDIVIPVYNEGQNILAVLDSFRRSVKRPFRVLICYDRDDDNTLPVIRSYAGGVEIIPVKNRGQGVHAAVVSGFHASTAPAVVMIPADDVHNAAILDEMVDKLEEGSDIVAPSRFMKGGRMVGCPWVKAILVRTAAFVLYHLACLPTHDPTNGFRLFSRRVLDLVPIESSEGFIYSIELLVKCHRLGWKVTEVPSVWYERTKGKSRFKLLKWCPAYLPWVFYAFATTYFFRGPETVVMRQRPKPATL
jgi:glycosyltransferase involved in cell wall biosynthesis